MPVTNLAELDALVARVKAAQKEFASFSQEQVDAIICPGMRPEPERHFLCTCGNRLFQQQNGRF